MIEQKHKLRFIIRGTGELQEMESENADSIRDALCNIYALPARNKNETCLLFDALFQRTFNTHVDLTHNIAVQPGDTASGLRTQYGAVMYATRENNLSIENIAPVLQEIPTTGSPSQCWVAVVTGLIKALGGTTRNTEITLRNQTKAGESTVEITYEMYGPISQQAEKLSFHENENMQLESVVEEMRASIALTEEKLVQLTSDNPDEFPVSLVWFRYFTYGIQWSFFVSFRDGRFVSIRAMNDGIAIQAKSGNLTIGDSMRSFTDAFVHTSENWKRALRTAVALIDADSISEIAQMTRTVKYLTQHRWGQPLLTRFLP